MKRRFAYKLKTASPRSEIRDLDPILDRLRSIKNPADIALIREATRITGLAIIEAMRDARPGMYEYELQADAEYIFKKYGAYGPSFFALIATGPNTFSRTTTRTQRNCRRATWSSVIRHPITRTTRPTSRACSRLRANLRRGSANTTVSICFCTRRS